ncbi:MAG: ATP-binding protein, partial [Pseudomonadota bacterium]
MIGILGKTFWPRVEGKPLATAQLRTLTTLCWIAALAGPLMLFLLKGEIDQESNDHAIATVLGIGVFAVFPILIRIGVPRILASYSFVLYAIGLLTYQCFELGGFLSIKAMLFAPIAIVSTFILGWRGGLFSVGITLIALFALFFAGGVAPYADLYGGDTNQVSIDSAIFNVFIGVTLNVVFSASAAALFQREMDRSLKALTKARSEADAANRSKSEFLANMSHEIRTPMNGVIGMAELLQSASLPPREKSFATTIHESGLALLTIVNDILDFSKIEAGKLELDPVPFDFHQAVDDVATLLGSGARQKKIDLSVRYDPSLPKRFIGDAGRLRQILTNLLGNAIKFTHEGSVVISVSGRETGDTALLRIEIDDTGIGIPQQTVATIFDKFTQAESSTTRRFGGTGLGLSITKSLVDAMDGKIGVKSVLGKGSTFWLELDLPIDASTAESSRVDEGSDASISGLRALIVDDLSVNRTILEEALVSVGVEAVSVSSGKDAIDEIMSSGQRGFDVAIIDFQMPVMDGLGLAREIRHVNATNIAIVVLSSVDDDKVRHEFKAIERLEYMTKPARIDEVKRVISGLISAHQIEDRAVGNESVVEPSDGTASVSAQDA